MPIASTANYKTRSGISTAGYDTVLDVLLPAVQADLERACGRAFDQATYTDEEYHGRGERSIWLRNTPVTTLTTVKTRDNAGTATTLESTDYRLDGTTGELRRLEPSDWAREERPRVLGISTAGYPVWPDEMLNVLVTYTGGYATAPDDLKNLFYTLVDAAWDNIRENWTLAQAADGVKQRTFLNGKMYAQAKAELIRPWNRMVV